MNRKLHNTILAFSVTGVMLAVGLLAAQPVLPTPQDELHAAPVARTALAPVVAALAAPSADARAGASDAAADAFAARIDARGRRLEAELAKAESFEHAIAATAGFIAVVATEAAVAGALGELDADAAEPAEETERRSEAPRKRSHVRSAIAVPYFSFARGTGRGDRS